MVSKTPERDFVNMQRTLLSNFYHIHLLSKKIPEQTTISLKNHFFSLETSESPKFEKK